MHDEVSDLGQVVITALDEMGWQHADRDGWRVARVQGHHGAYEMIYGADPATRLVQVYCGIPVRAPAERRVAVAELLTRVNWRVLLGGFEMDFSDGEVRFRISVDVEGGVLVPRMVRNMTYASLVACDRFFGALMRVMHAGLTPEEALAVDDAPADEEPASHEVGPAEDDPEARARAVQALLDSLDATVHEEEEEDEEENEFPATPDTPDTPDTPRAEGAPTPRAERARGCLLGGAVGDALGAPVEFLTLGAIRRRYGDHGIQELDEAYGRVGAITDDTQMTLFTAEGLLRADTRGSERGVCHPPTIVYHAYLRWLRTQDPRSPEPPSLAEAPGWLIGVRALHSRRAPGNTCLSALASGRMGTIDEPLNDSKGCGGVMRSAPVGVRAFGEPFRLGAEIAAITHGHPSGYLSAGALAEMVHHLMAGVPLVRAVHAALELLVGERGHEETTAALHRALDAWRAGPPTAERVESLGAGWVAEEALAISVYCALAAGDDFAAGVRLAVNHSGDSDSTGAITGNLLGAALGVSAIPARWLEQLELRAEIEALADDLAAGWRAGDGAWWERYPGC